MLQHPETTEPAPGALACVAETRIGPSAVFGQTRTEPLACLTSTSHRACGNSWSEVASDLGLYSQPDPVGLRGGMNLYAYALGNPVLLVDRDGRRPICCSESSETLYAEADRLLARSKSLTATSGFDGPPVPVVDTYCSEAAIGGRPFTFFSPAYWRLGTCMQACARAHEAVHSSHCRRFGPDYAWVPDAYAMDDAIAYSVEVLCLLRAGNNGNIDVERDFHDFGPIPVPPHR